MSFINFSRNEQGLMSVDSKGQLAYITTKAESLKQRIESHLRMFKGEVYDNEDAGVPYYSEVLVKNPDIASTKALLIYQTSLVDGVSKVNSFAVDFDSQAREFRVSYNVTGVDGTMVSGVL